MSEYHSLLSTYKIEMDSPYNDGYSQLHYKELYEELLNLGEKEFTKNTMNRKIQDIEDKIEILNIQLKNLKSELSVVN